VSTKAKTIQDNFDYILKDFEIDSNPQVLLEDIGNGIGIIKEYEIDFPPNQVSFHPYIVFIIFVYIKQFQFSEKWEKVAWEIPIKFKGTPFILTHRKFGFKIISTSDSDLITKKGLEAISQIQKAIPLSEKIIEPLIKSKVNNGEITLNNEYTNISRRYSFFRENTEKEFAEINTKQKPTGQKSDKGLSAFVKAHNKSMKRLQKANYFMTAMLDSYFCLLEHTLVLLVPFLNNNKLNGIDIETFIGYNWKEKYKTLFSLSTDNKALQLLERLDRIKEQLRNPLTHGYFLKNGHSFFVQMEQIGSIPMTLTKTNQQLKYFFGGIAPLTFKEVCKCFDDCDKFLYLHKQTKFGMQFIKSGLPVAFDKSSCDMYKSAMITRKYFDEFIDYIGRQHDDALNMDW
jgi:hypothetical protein